VDGRVELGGGLDESETVLKDDIANGIGQHVAPNRQNKCAQGDQGAVGDSLERSGERVTMTYNADLRNTRVES
jgi:hypothetical protein